MEGVAQEDVEIDGSQGVFYQNKGLSNLIWSIDEYAFWIEANLNKTDLINIAISVNIVE